MVTGVGGEREAQQGPSQNHRGTQGVPSRHAWGLWGWQVSGWLYHEDTV